MELASRDSSKFYGQHHRSIILWVYCVFTFWLFIEFMDRRRDSLEPYSVAFLDRMCCLFFKLLTFTTFAIHWSLRSAAHARRRRLLTIATQSSLMNFTLFHQVRIIAHSAEPWLDSTSASLLRFSRCCPRDARWHLCCDATRGLMTPLSSHRSACCGAPQIPQENAKSHSWLLAFG